MKTVRGKHGFSLIELLTVIAIIAILAAIIFPVMSSVKAEARKTKCMTQLQQIASAMKMFQTDNRKYPESLGGFVQYDGEGIVPMERSRGDALYPQYVKSVSVFHCPDSPVTNTNSVVRISVGGQNFDYYAYDSYDVFVPNPVEPGAVVPAGIPDIRYTTQWADSVASVSLLPPSAGKSDGDGLRRYDFKRQLHFRNPSDDTVVTWCSYHAKQGDTKSMVLVLFLDGHVDKIPAVQVQGDPSTGAVGSRQRTSPKL